jgi:hypothetical protein
MLSQPLSQSGFLKFTGSQGENDAHHLGLLGVNAQTVQSKEDVHGLERNSLVAVDERVIAGEAESVRGCEIDEVGLGLVMKSIPRPSQSRIKKALVS